MAGHKYTQEQLDFLRENATKFSRRELTEQFNTLFGTEQSTTSIRLVCNRRGYYNPRTDIYTEEQLEFLRSNAPTSTRKELTELFNETFVENKTVSSIASTCKRYKFRFPSDGRFSEERGFAWRKGLTREEQAEHFSDEAWRRMTDRLKEHREKYEVGDIYNLKCGDTYRKYIVVSTDYSLDLKHRIYPYNRYVWEQANGKLPDGYKITHLDGNPQNCNIENLLAVSEAENMKLATAHWSGKGEITKTGVAIFRLEKAINEAR